MYTYAYTHEPFVHIHLYMYMRAHVSFALHCKPIHVTVLHLHLYLTFTQTVVCIHVHMESRRLNRQLNNPCAESGRGLEICKNAARPTGLGHHRNYNHMSLSNGRCVSMDGLTHSKGLVKSSARPPSARGLPTHCMCICISTYEFTHTYTYTHYGIHGH